MSADRVNNTRKTRGRPFSPGNSGRPKGAKNKRTILVENIFAEDLEAIARAINAAAKDGDMQAARIIIDRLAPARRGRPVRFQAPIVIDAQGIAAAFGDIVGRMAAGEV